MAQSAPGRGEHSASRSRSKSLTTAARERTYASRDISQLRERDPGETLLSLSIPDEEEELAAEVEAAKQLAAVVVAEKGGEPIVEKGAAIASEPRVVAGLDSDVGVLGGDVVARTNAGVTDD